MFINASCKLCELRSWWKVVIFIRQSWYIILLTKRRIYLISVPYSRTGKVHCVCPVIRTSRFSCNEYHRLGTHRLSGILFKSHPVKNNLSVIYRIEFRHTYSAIFNCLYCNSQTSWFIYCVVIEISLSVCVLQFNYVSWCRSCVIIRNRCCLCLKKSFLFHYLHS